MKNSRDNTLQAPRGSPVKRRIKSVVFFCLYYSGLEWLLSRLIRVDATAILMYHGVCDESPMPPDLNFHLKRSVFEHQMRVLKRRYPVLALRDVVDALARGERPKKAIVLTFDDGYRNNAQYATPILTQLQLPVTVFVATSYIESGRWIPLNEIYWLWSSGKLSSQDLKRIRSQVRGRASAENAPLLSGLLNGHPPAATFAAKESFDMLSWDEVRGMAEAGVDFGSHTHTHCNLAAEPPSQQRTELELSKTTLERRLGRPVRTFAYPFGLAEHISETARANIVNAGFDCALAAEYGLVTSRSDCFRLPRLGYDRHIWMFAGEILYQFALQAIRDARGTKEAHG